MTPLMNQKQRENNKCYLDLWFEPYLSHLNAFKISLFSHVNQHDFSKNENLVEFTAV